ncbi:hypothetical protein NHN26_08880 [Rhodovulum tesquicola]|uniref:Uncharacterized protein n=1 Tax=Rhodovulum steppense TaxID=540251 RepID=A0A4R1YN97_9RHOB|nr:MULTISPECIES: hypothetical protein [Rhodovulum]MCO8145338.1 hypothetical protein [Rhodovulum tesquicola]TCM79259.1 hypothetical protein EV216_12311 [Rhodovulum steppense]
MYLDRNLEATGVIEETADTRSKVETPESGLRSCRGCGTAFRPRRSNQLSCSKTCRDKVAKRKARRITPANSLCSPTKRRANLELLDRARRLAEILYTLPPRERLGFVKTLVDQARTGDGKLREVLTNRFILRPETDMRSLFHRGSPRSYLTIAQAANEYCWRFWNADVRSVVYGLVSEPETGEVA